jgi:hypothetical protein
VVHDWEFIHPNEVIRVSSMLITDYRESLKLMGEGATVLSNWVVSGIVRYKKWQDGY